MTSSSSTSLSYSQIPHVIYVTPPTATSLSSFSSAHSPIPLYTGSGNLLMGYCADPLFTIIPNPTVDFYIAVIGCVSSKPDCCIHTLTGNGTAQERSEDRGQCTQSSHIGEPYGTSRSYFFVTYARNP